MLQKVAGENKTIATCFLVVINDDINQNAEMSISNDELKVSVCKNKNILHIYNSGASWIILMKLQVCQFEALEERYDKAK